MNSLIEFYWQVPVTGFEWIESREFESLDKIIKSGRKPRGAYLVRQLANGAPLLARNYPALKETGLFWKFASTEPTKDGVLGFANQFGLLGGSFTLPVDRPLGPEPNTYFSDDGESFETWVAEILTMNHLIALWLMCRDGSRKELAKFIGWAGRHGKGEDAYPHTEVRYRGPKLPFEKAPVSLLIASERTNPEKLARFQHGDVLQPGWYALQQLVNRKLKEHRANPQLLWNHTRKSSDLLMRFVPQSLIGALWLQFAHAITGNKEYRQCEQCSRWFEVAAEVRADGKYCRNACRSKAYRNRQADARKLRAKGVSLKEIAGKLGSDAKTVKGWISK